MIGSFDFVASGTTYHVCYTARARYLFEQLCGYPMERLSAFRGQVSEVEMARLVTAGLEGHRLREKARKAPWTVDEVLDDVLDDLGVEERAAVFARCLEAVAAAFRTAAEQEAAKGAEGKAPPTTG